MIWKTWSHLSSYFLTKSIFSNWIFILCYLILCNQIKTNLYFSNLNIYFISKLRLTQSSWIRTYFITSIVFGSLGKYLSSFWRRYQGLLNHFNLVISLLFRISVIYIFIYIWRRKKNWSDPFMIISLYCVAKEFIHVLQLW